MKELNPDPVTQTAPVPPRFPTREQQRTIRELFKPGCWKQHVKPPDEDGYVRCKVWGPWNSSGWYRIAPDGTVT